MAILINENTKVLVQGITGTQGSLATKDMLDYGTNVLCGVTPGKGGRKVEGVPVYDDVESARRAHDVSVSVIYVPPKFVKNAALEAINAGMKCVVIVTEGVPIHDSAQILARARETHTRVIGPSSIGIISPGKAKVGSIAMGKDHKSFTPGNIGIISKSGGMCSETALVVRKAGFGQSTVVGIGGDVLVGSDFVDILKIFENDKETAAIVLFGEIGGAYEELAAEYIKQHISKPVVAFVSGIFASTIQDVSLGHAGAIIEQGRGTRSNKVEALRNAGVRVVDVHHEIGAVLREMLG